MYVVYNLSNHVTFPMYRSGSILDPVVTDVPPLLVHGVILTRITFRRPRDESSTRTLWQWEDANRKQLLLCLATRNSASLQAERLTEVLLVAQEWRVRNGRRCSTGQCVGHTVLEHVRQRHAKYRPERTCICQ
ncbi:hypothetical protein E2C01_081635 [Portunus trituberculatus]|uniref:Uncharacterized protein n=1 Tax=Portunus trituberculatus TaxID=210409 RepID=A0A5B7IX36_PORTR|nr:hypothetical protein [Portunus trituberculatus]